MMRLMKAGKAFRTWLERREVGRPKAAKDLGVSPSQLHYWFNGSRPSAENREKIARYTCGDIPVTMWE